MICGYDQLLPVPHAIRARSSPVRNHLRSHSGEVHQISPWNAGAETAAELVFTDQLNDALLFISPSHKSH